MSTKYYIDKDGDLWKYNEGELSVLLISEQFKNNEHYRKWLIHASGMDSIVSYKLRYKLVPISYEEFLMELL